MTVFTRHFTVDVLSDNDNFIKFKEAMEQLSIKLANIPKTKMITAILKQDTR